MSMMTLEAALSPPPDVLEGAGGFLWWYADMVDAAGNGAVLIWAYGLPFLPGLATAERAGRPQAPGRRPSLNLAVYERGRQVFYLLQEFRPDQVTGTGPEWQFGRNRLLFTAEDTSGVLRADLDMDIPGGGTARARLEIRGAIRRGGAAGAPGGLHGWSPLLAAAAGSLDLEAPGCHIRISGVGYHDRNWGRAALHRLGIRAWCWGRLSDGETEWIWYALQPDGDHAAEELLVRIDRDGTCAVLPGRIVLGGWRRDRFGVAMPAEVRMEPEGAAPVVAVCTAVVDRGPFYLRWQIRQEGGQARGFAECCQPARIDDARWRDFVAMCVAPPEGRGSWLLPWFSGPVQDRHARLLQSLR